MNRFSNPVGALQEKCVAENIPHPCYVDKDKTGPDHTPLFTCQVTVKDLVAEGTAGSKQKAKKNAAEEMLSLLENYDRNSSFLDHGSFSQYLVLVSKTAR